MVCTLPAFRKSRPYYWILTSIGYPAPTTHSKIKARLVSVYGISLRIPGSEGADRVPRTTENSKLAFGRKDIAHVRQLLHVSVDHSAITVPSSSSLSTDELSRIGSKSGLLFLFVRGSWRREITLAHAVSLFKTNRSALGRGLHSLTIIPSRWGPRITTKLSHFAAPHRGRK